MCRSDICIETVGLEVWREKDELHVAFMDPKKAYDKVCREALWRVLRECGVDGYLIRSMRSNLYNGSRACVRLGSRVEEYFEVRRGIRQWYIMSL